MSAKIGMLAVSLRAGGPIETLLLLPVAALRSVEGAVRHLVKRVGRDYNVLVVRSRQSKRRFTVRKPRRWFTVS